MEPHSKATGVCRKILRLSLEFKRYRHIPGLCHLCSSWVRVILSSCSWSFSFLQHCLPPTTSLICV